MIRQQGLGRFWISRSVRANTKPVLLSNFENKLPLRPLNTQLFSSFETGPRHDIDVHGRVPVAEKEGWLSVE